VPSTGFSTAEPDESSVRYLRALDEVLAEVADMDDPTVRDLRGRVAATGVAATSGALTPERAGEAAFGVIEAAFAFTREPPTDPARREAAERLLAERDRLRAELDLRRADPRSVPRTGARSLLRAALGRRR
jgi:hypothetical protein